MPRQYEVVYIFDSALEEAEINEKLERFHAPLKSPETPNLITAQSHWGKRTLAYPIKGKDIGYYVVVQFETEPHLLTEFERIVKLDESVMRHLVVLNDGLAPQPAAVSAGEARPDDDRDRDRSRGREEDDE